MTPIESKHIRALAFVVALAGLGGQISGGPAVAAEQPYTSARDCLRTVNEVESRAESQEGGASAETKELLAQAQDLCMQTRYQRVQELLKRVRKTVASN